ncbi:glycoside hydrolase family 25 [Firmicutes bacterium CAG:822]|nr:glycoside hydrolase family 25 [Firmicutes bacterium CAG:822]
MYTIYQVQNGDTLASVASNFGISVNNLSSLNGIMVGSLLNPGDYIVVPKVQNENPYFREYVVKKGDSIYGIARANNISPSQLLRLNGLNDTDIIYPDQKIMLPRNGVSFYITESDDTLNDVTKGLNVSANELARQNGTIYLTNDQLIVYKK